MPTSPTTPTPASSTGSLIPNLTKVLFDSEASTSSNASPSFTVQEFSIARPTLDLASVKTSNASNGSLWSSPQPLSDGQALPLHALVAIPTSAAVVVLVLLGILGQWMSPLQTSNASNGSLWSSPQPLSDGQALPLHALVAIPTSAAVVVLVLLGILGQWMSPLQTSNASNGSLWSSPQPLSDGQALPLHALVAIPTSAAVVVLVLLGILAGVCWRRQRLAPADAPTFKTDSDSAWDSLSLNFIDNPHDFATVKGLSESGNGGSSWDWEASYSDDSYYASLEEAIAAQAKATSFANHAFSSSSSSTRPSSSVTTTSESAT